MQVIDSVSVQFFIAPPPYPSDACRVESVMVSSVSSPISIICVFSFFLCLPCQRLVNLTELFKAPMFCFIDFLCCFSVHNFSDFCSSLYYFLPSCVRLVLLFISWFLTMGASISHRRIVLFFAADVSAVNFPPCTAAAPHVWVRCVFVSFSVFVCVFPDSSETPSLTHGLFGSVLLGFQAFHMERSISRSFSTCPPVISTLILRWSENIPCRTSAL